MARRRNRRLEISAPQQRGIQEIETAKFRMYAQSENASSTDNDSAPADTLNYLQAEDHCVMCNAKSARRCLWCQSTSYCSLKCQEEDFTMHKLLCQLIPSFPPRPSPEIITAPYLGYDEPKKGRVRIEENLVRSQTFGTGFKHGNLQRDGHCVTMVYRAGGNPCPNESILTSLRPPGVEQSPFRGPVLAVRERPGKLYEDIAMSDFRHLIDYLISFHLTRPLAEPFTGPMRPVHGVLIRCCGETQDNWGVSFKSADLSTVGCAPGDNGAISQISKLLGMPLRLRKCAINGFFEDVTNPNASMLMLMLNPERKDWGMPSSHWALNIGNVFVVRDDGKNLKVEDVEMICYFARFKVHPMFQRIAQEICELESADADEDEDEDVPIVGPKQKALECINWENMVQHWNVVW
ncbi:hypothetical protein ASPSYDRAFT_73415 [Aspergillus sydowii CBS 593.65]|uniref:MYND-type domain-containing protein n=1 Tax=Aspergillus sydowii CBS 593.65 TaxID=1036612 RepID=A0A1L9T058_9EURO|nr:uncharacterized protein ASPSYDRAFT_73415 [Aspergillus sydowii CBS 593.65]OJJ52854.1 hypothetical protein ASPSYDRAFT_73415 [Aspergillus sydowii CBS 593.65]